MSVRFKLKPLAIAMMPIFVAGTHSFALAQETAQQNTTSTAEADKDDELEIIEVKGFRGSLQKAINQKRLADGVQDSIFAEDIGKSTDQNIADALSRVTGISVQESNGEGTRFSARGASAGLNQVSLNGVQLTSSLSGSGRAGSVSDQSVDLSTISSDILASIDVYKTSAADHDEGSLGANVVLRTVKPLNISEDRRSVELQGRYNDFSDEDDFKVSGNFTKKLFDETFGIIVTAAKERQHTRRDELTGNWQTPYEAVNVVGGYTSLQTGQVVDADTTAIIRNSTGYEVNLDKQDKLTVTTGFQFIPTDTTDIQLDLSYSKQDKYSDSHKIGTDAPDVNDPNQLTDDQASWYTIDENSRTLVKSLNRHGKGSLGRNIGGNDTENKIATFRVQQEITDDLRMDFTAGYSSTQYASKPNNNINTATWGFIPKEAIEKIDSELIEPVGYDCSTGSCQIVTGTTPFIYVPEGINNNQANIATSRFNPLDPYGHHIGFFSKFSETTDDINKSVFLDFDWDVDIAGVTSFEFGAKWSNRAKDTKTNYQTFTDNGVSIFDPETGQPIKGNSVADVGFADIISGVGLPVDNFMDGLIANNSSYSSEFLKGWGILDPSKAFEEVFNIPDTRIADNRAGSRNIAQDNISLYGKVNFEYFDSKLTGNVGVRYVKTEVESIGTPSVSYFSGDRLFNPNELIYDNQLANTNLASCGETTGANQTDRIDGSYPCFEPRLSPEGELQVSYDDAGNVVDILRNDAGGDRSWWWLFRHADESTQQKLGAEVFPDNPEAIFRREFNGRGEHSTSLLLPSLNLNYAIDDEWIARFAVSRTMARPGFDDLNPAFSFNENVWGDFSSMNISNPKLDPLKSNNIDLSLEWYFDKTGLFSIALFKKDMKDFLQTVQSNVFVADIRRDYTQEQLNLEDFLIQEDPSLNPQNSNCHPDRMVQDNITNVLRFECEPVVATISRNGNEQTSEGVELTFTKDMSFLPGIWSGLGVTANYTYAKSETSPEFEPLSGKFLQALPTAYTPKHSANTTIYWEQDGHQIRLAHRYNGVQLIGRPSNGVAWQDATSRLDLSGSYEYNQNVTVTFHALNLTDDTTRTFFTSTGLDLGEVDDQGNSILLDEGNAIDDSSVYKGRTLNEFKTGRQFRISARIKF